MCWLFCVCCASTWACFMFSVMYLCCAYRGPASCLLLCFCRAFIQGSMMLFLLRLSCIYRVLLHAGCSACMSSHSMLLVLHLLCISIGHSQLSVGCANARSTCVCKALIRVLLKKFHSMCSELLKWLAERCCL